MNVRLDSNLNSKKIGKFNYAEKIKLLEITDKYFEVKDNGKIIKGQWYKVTGKSNTKEIITGYVFSVFLTKPKQKDIFEFILYDDNYDNFYFTAKKEKSTSSFITNGEEINFLRGDIIEIEWEEVIIKSAGDEGVKELNNRLLKVKKIKNGIVSNFRKNYKKKIKYYYTDNYSQWYLDYIYLNIEYYIANSKNKLIRDFIKKKEQLEYSIENRRRNGINYLVIGISHTSEFKTSYLQWLYYNEKNKKLYEYNLSNDKLIEFKY
ncbi:SH3 domain-containing protein [uncultured Tenacibaculum sp.]|uniref:SH3 domain-containing protein n=1 Tax=uncultured Tenacibaculum sp. TaxID=174713 RepID=UPI00261B3C5D|nr:SH3 domain-containing protein [uncultured Tenacibaculum sp.]